jgi:hypothetical protein
MSTITSITPRHQISIEDATAAVEAAMENCLRNYEQASEFADEDDVVPRSELMETAQAHATRLLVALTALTANVEYSREVYVHGRRQAVRAVHGD